MPCVAFVWSLPLRLAAIVWCYGGGTKRLLSRRSQVPEMTLHDWLTCSTGVVRLIRHKDRFSSTSVTRQEGRADGRPLALLDLHLPVVHV